MMRHFYTFLMYLLQPFVLLFMLIRSLKAPQYRRRFGERYGFYRNLTAPQAQGVLIHAASVGEVIAATPLIRRIQTDYPELAVTVTTMTPTGSERVKAAFGNSVTHVYLPYDLPDTVARFIRFIRPKLCIVIETELWPNLIHGLHLHQIPFIIANARLSARSARRYVKFKGALREMLSEIELIAPQDEFSEKRYREIGYRGRISLTGNIKYDLHIGDELLNKIKELKAKIGKRPVWIAASTHQGEEEIILKSYRTLLQKYPNLLLVLVPRHPEQFNAVAEMIEKAGFTYARRSTNGTPNADTRIFLGDTMGELMLLYGTADLAFVGGSLIKRGGHNPLEPLAFKCPVISGKYTFNFPEVFAKLKQVGGVIEIEENDAVLSQAVTDLLDNKTLRERLANAGYTVLTENRGALQRLLDLLKPYLEK
ncbi:lipid IV(A) 3-deoxy-D-manno-octulosonic acid transferase [Bisgaard Taxon 10/6]|uniref:3-deoxy-D-manno-octulosonic acid transferase n=1 Tax=Exercitatus varius TaxID=67857 RepID=A0ABT6EP48_9PAST|nr:lipid IV(A) 3-deoxy-D-manno-octulosonic acid transferase [Exercitatus varius]MDG2940017.1 lipid IV(A) 3-deoxy-D-manno-octulosonic acid transferase [Exercitatus varius]MDG2945312.1 lipid IV(A) 3-deoxy-D-manno-octulosonic acid transferase [Exercitatus varius]MDG2956396.1 lipid IV(A) 3-deoxy-D-manno-octulosonic acid transferase [Exercitatus varius]MDG2961941.1 lipid IV(A) 3-deoxy-D-manno-octulosonic acid transferase [Exercitatus varius]MDG2965063.1 lipid IV(A) 3-deoxy-D-manno-octulosonic acid 